MRGLRRALLAVALVATTACNSEGAESTTAPTTTRAAETSTSATGGPTTSAPDGDLDVIEAGVAAFYSGNAERAAELFELADRTDDQIRAESAYQAAIGGRLSLSCTESSAGEFNCLTPYRNAMTDAIGEGGGHDTWPVVVEDGVITQFGFTEHTGMLIEMGTFLASEGRFDGYEDCVFGPFPESCATIQLENLDDWVEWRQDVEPADQVTVALESWYGGDCEAAVLLSWETDTDCSASSLQAQAIEYESILGAKVSVEDCETTSGGDNTGLSCEVHYSNAMNSAVGKPPSVTAREFVLMFGLLTAGLDEETWYERDYPEDTELRDSFGMFADASDLSVEYAAASCESARTPECANLIMDNLDEWAAWYEANG